MLLACPECHSTFRIKPAALESGRIVRCSHCRYEWFAEQRDLLPEPEAADRPAPPAPPPPSEPVFELPESVEESERMKLAQNLEEAEARFQPEPEETDEPETEFVEEVELQDGFGPEDPQIDFENLENVFGPGPTSAPEDDTPRKPPYMLVGILLVIGILLCLVTFLFINRDELMDTPVAGDMLNVAGVSHVEGITFADLSLTTKKIGTKKARYTVKGAVINQSETERPMPTVRLKLMSKDGKMVEEWIFSQPGTIKPGERKNFNAPDLASTTARTDEAFVLDLANDFDLMLR